VHGNFQNTPAHKKLMSPLISRRENLWTLFSLLFLPSLAGIFLASCRREVGSKAAAPAPKLAQPSDQKIARRVVTLTPSLTELVFALGAGDRVVAVSDYCDYPEAAKARPHVGSFLSPAIERILSLQPDLVLLDGVQRDAATMLTQAGARAVAVPMQDLAQVRGAFTVVGEQLGDRQPQAAALLADLDRQIAAVSARVSSLPPRKTMFVVDRQIGSLRGLVAAGPGSYLDELMRLAGGQNVFADMGPRYAKVAAETIEERQPDVILDAIHTDPAGAAARREDWSLLGSVAAVKNGRVHILANRMFVTPGPRLGRALQEIAALLHPPQPPITAQPSR
jgi:iron complex transport system substrate-binding protein